MLDESSSGAARMIFSRSLFLRGLGLIYLIAFLSLEWQVTGLLGSDGLRPASDYLDQVRESLGGVDLARIPTLFWLGSGDIALRAACWVGAGASLLVIGGMVPLAGLVACWLLYLSFVGIGAPFLNYQWDALLLETGFLALFWAPATSRLASPLAAAPSSIVRWLLVWLLFRLMFFSGWVKLASGDPAWWDLSALEYHYATQPLPTWTAWYMHQLPAWFQKLSVAGTFAIELVVPFLILAGRRGRAVAAAAFLGLQIFIGATGNYGFFNALSALLCVPLLDDAQLLRLVPRSLHHRVSSTSLAPAPFRTAVHAVAGVLLLVLTVPTSVAQLTGIRSLSAAVAPLARLVSPWHLTSRYGLFAVMTKTRPEVLIEGSEDGVTWRPYTFRWKPGALDRRPTFVEPDMPRLDWQMWFDGLYIERAIETRRRAFNVVTPSVVERLKEGSPAVLGLLGPNPFPDGPPTHIRWRLYEYEFTTSAERASTGNWWRRELVYGD